MYSLSSRATSKLEAKQLNSWAVEQLYLIL